MKPFQLTAKKTAELAQLSTFVQDKLTCSISSAANRGDFEITFSFPDVQAATRWQQILQNQGFVTTRHSRMAYVLLINWEPDVK